jgi:hypothetical protein
MSLKIGGHLFTGPFELDSTKVPANRIPAVFAIICRAGEPWNPTFRVIDIGASAPAGTYFADHLDRPRWERDNDGKLGVYLLELGRSDGYDQAARERLAAALRERFPPPSAMVPIHGGM